MPESSLTTEQYDNSGRHTATNADLYDDSCTEGKYTDTNTYDAENHPVQTVQTGAVASNSGITTWGLRWGPNGHPVALQQSPNSTNLTANPSTTYLHYDGDILLFTTYANGQLTDVRPELLGTYCPATAAGGTPGLAVLDRDFSELNVTSHSASGYSGLNYGSGPFHTGKVTIPQTVYEPGSDGTPPYFDNGQPEPSLQYTHPDGFSTPLGRIQGVRAMDTDLGTWKSPDAYAGDVHDPLSQKPYMWNRNNPYEYSDPSGYEPGTIELTARRGHLLHPKHGDVHGLRVRSPRADRLPTGGNYPYEPPKSKGDVMPRKDGSIPDSYGNDWKWDPKKQEWDVQHRNGSHTNIGPDGNITHGEDNMPQRPKPRPKGEKI